MDSVTGAGTGASDASNPPIDNPNIASALHLMAARHPDRSAVIEYRKGQVRRVTFAALSTEILRTARILRERGIGPGDRVLILIPMSADLYAVLLGCLHLGATVVFVDAWAGRKRLEDAVAAADPRALVGTRKGLWLRLLSRSLRRVPLKLRVRPGQGLIVGRGGMASSSASPPPPALRVEPDHPALVTFTTGSTGQPKGAIRSHRFLWAQHHALNRHMRPRDDDVDMPTLPIFVLNNLASGIPSVLPDFDPRKPAEVDPARILRQMTEEGVTTSTGSPAFYERLAIWGSENGEELPLRALFTGGAPVLPPLARLLSRVVMGHAHVLYGSTEAEPISGITVEAMLEADAGGNGGRGSISHAGGEAVEEDAGGPGASTAPADIRSGPLRGLCAGRPVPETAVKVLRPHDGPIRIGEAGWPEWEVEPGEPGELVVAGEHVLDGYLGDPGAEALAKIPDPDGVMAGGSRRIWHRTGDGARVDGGGRIWLLGRVGSRVVRDGLVWWPLPAELRALSLPEVRHAAYLGRSDPGLGARAVLCVEVDRGQLNGDGRRRLTNALGAIPVDELVVLRRIPRDPRHASKTDMGALRARLKRR